MQDVSIDTRQGPRSYQEDRFFSLFLRIRELKCNGWLLAVMDGHGGSEVSEYCKNNLQRYIEMQDFEDSECALEKLIASLACDTNEMKAGTTISVAFIPENGDKVSLAILGDSPVVVISDEGTMYTFATHNVRTNQAELDRAEEQGARYSQGYIFYGTRGLQMGRALGDVSLAPILSREPDIYTIHKPKVVLVATDGVVDPEHSGDSALMEKIEEKIKSGVNAKDFLSWREEYKPFEDNATAIIWRK